MVMLGGGFKSGHSLSKQDLMKAKRTRLINKHLKSKGLPVLTASQKGKLNRGEITEKQLLKGSGLLTTLGSLGDSIFGLGEGGFDDTMQYIAGGKSHSRSRSKVHMSGAGIFSSLSNLAKKGVAHLANNPDLVNAGIGLLQNVLGHGGVSMGGVEMGGAMRRRPRARKSKMAGSGLLTTLGSLGDSIFGLGEGGVEMGGAMHKRGRGRPRGGVALGGFDDTMQYIAGGAKKRRPRKMKGSGLLTTLGSLGDSIFGLGEGVKRGRGRPRKARGGVSMGGESMFFEGL